MSFSSWGVARAIADKSVMESINWDCIMIESKFLKVFIYLLLFFFFFGAKAWVTEVPAKIASNVCSGKMNL